MSSDPLTTAHLDYLQRTATAPGPIDFRDERTWAPRTLRQLVRIRGIGRLDKRTGDEHPPTVETFRLVTEDLLAGLYNYELPLAFMIRGEPGSVSINVGTWLVDGNDPAVVVANATVLRALLSSLYPWIELADADPMVPQHGAGGLVLGVPTIKLPDVADGAVPLDRLVRAMTGARWTVLVLAQPVGESFTRDLRLQVINEMRAAATAAKAGGFPSPLADHYTELLKSIMVALTQGQTVGAWRTAVYLLGDGDSYYRLSSAWRGIFSGERSLPEPVRVWDLPEAEGLADRWQMASPTDLPAPGLYRRPFEHQTLLTSAQLAAYVHLPEVETGGFAVSVVPDFDTVPSDRADGVMLGHVVERAQRTARAYVVPAKELTRHTFVAGVTGSGKTNTVFHLLQQAFSAQVPFLVMEPAKTEYRALIADPTMGRVVQVFTLGDENVSPFRLNPFECPEGVPIGVHLDLLRSVFNVSFGMWTPLPQVLEICLHRIYQDRGWDITANRNRRIGDHTDRARAFPTLSDLAAKVDEVAGQLGYEERVTADIRAALRTRLDSLRTGGKGRMLDVQRSLPMGLLTQRPTVLELDRMGDDDDKAFVMGLVMIRLVEHLRAGGEHDGLRHVLVIEEAHRLLAATSGPAVREEFQADVRGKAVETFANLLAEIRAYGEGVVVVDQVPTKLAPEVIKNTNLKLAHRVVAGDDRAVLAASMVMSERQERSLATLPLGQASVFADGDDSPLLLQVPLAKGSAAAIPNAAQVRDHTDASADLAALHALFLPSGDCDESCASSPEACAVAREIVADPAFQATFARTVLSTVTDGGALERLWPDLVATINPLRPPWIAAPELLRTLSTHAARHLAARRGAQGGWTYTLTDEFASSLQHTLVAGTDAAPEAIAAFQKLARDALGNGGGPFPACERIWAGEDSSCLCRFAVADLVADHALDAAWRQADEIDAQSAEGTRTETWEVCQDAAYRLIEYPEDDWPDDQRNQTLATARRIALCFGQQALARDPQVHPRTKRRVINKLTREAGFDEPTG